MNGQKLVIFAIGLSLVALLGVSANAEFTKNSPAPQIVATDIEGKTVNLNEILAKEGDLVILFFFTARAGEDMLLKLNTLDRRHPKEEVEIIALGIQDEAVELKAFAERLGIQYYILSKETAEGKTWAQQVEVFPTTLFIAPQNKNIERVLRGDSERNRNILMQVAENFYQQRSAAALKAADLAIEAGEDENGAREIKGFYFAATGKMDEAEKEFTAIGSQTGLAKVAYERGDYDKSIALASQSDDPYAQSIKGQAQIKVGQLREAEATLKAAASGGSAWQRSETANALGRIQHQNGNTDGAIKTYQDAVALDPYNIVALSNEGAAQRENGNLEAANAVLERASRIRNDDLVTMMLQQIQADMKEANDLQRRELIRNQIADLGARYKAMQGSDAQQPVDDWTSRPLVLALLPESGQSPVFFTRAGTDIVIQRELESRLQADNRVSVVERSMLDQLLQELNLGSSELASDTTRRRLGQVLSAGVFAFVQYAQLGTDPMIFLKLVDTETTSILFQTSHQIDEKNINGVVSDLTAEILRKITDDRELKGLIAQVNGDDEIIINLGKKHGATEGQIFSILRSDPVKVGDRVIAHRQTVIGKLRVTIVEDDFAICALTSKDDGVKLVSEMKVKASQ